MERSNKHDSLIIKGRRFKKTELNDNQVQSTLVASSVAKETGKKMVLTVGDKPVDDIWVNQKNMLFRKPNGKT